MRRRYSKVDLPVSNIRRYLEPGPIVLVSSAWQDETNIMTMGWHTVMEFTPSLVGCVIAGSNHSFELVRRSGECVINVPTTALTDEVVGIGNCSGASVDKFARFALTAEPAERVAAPLISGVLREPRMQARRWQPDRALQLLHLRSGQGACRDGAEISRDAALHRRWRVHGVRQDHQPARDVPPRDAVAPSSSCRRPGHRRGGRLLTRDPARDPGGCSNRLGSPACVSRAGFMGAVARGVGGAATANRNSDRRPTPAARRLAAGARSLSGRAGRLANARDVEHNRRTAVAPRGGPPRRRKR